MIIEAYVDGSTFHVKIKITSKIKQALHERFKESSEWQTWFQEVTSHCRCNDGGYITMSGSIESIINFDIAYDYNEGAGEYTHYNYTSHEDAEERLRLFNFWLKDYGNHALKILHDYFVDPSDFLGKLKADWQPAFPIEVSLNGNVFKLVATNQKDLGKSLTDDLNRQYTTLVDMFKNQIGAYKVSLKIKSDELIANSLPTFPKWFTFNSPMKRPIILSYNFPFNAVQFSTVILYKPEKWVTDGKLYRITNPIKSVKVWFTFCIRDNNRTNLKTCHLQRPIGKLFEHYHTLDTGYDCLGKTKEVELTSMLSLINFIESIELSLRTIDRDGIAYKAPRNKYLPSIDKYSLEKVTKEEGWIEKDKTT
ncbi:MAG: hypothetical protein KAU20_05675 [Nanoarchaeota archaeon]|nr:hypothetical protein [Nanoarchaeota archaeon]